MQSQVRFNRICDLWSFNSRKLVKIKRCGCGDTTEAYHVILQVYIGAIIAVQWSYYYGLLLVW